MRAIEKSAITLAGVGYSLIVLLGNGFLPVINNARPGDLEDVLFTFMTIVVELGVITPFVFVEQKHGGKPLAEFLSSRAAWTKYWSWFVAIGGIFAVATYLVVVGLSISDTNTGAVALKTMPISAIVIGFFFLQERVTKRHVACIAIMLLAVIHVATKGTWQLGELTLGPVLLLVPPVLWSIGHAMSKKLLLAKVVTATQMIAIRTSISGAMLGLVYLFTTAGSSAWQILDASHLIFMFLMGTNYAMIHYCWYKALQRIDMNLATGIGIPSPVITALLAALVLANPLHWYHVVGMIATFVGLYGLLHAGNQRIPKTSAILSKPDIEKD